MDAFRVKAFVYGWVKNPEILDFEGDNSSLVEAYIFRGINHDTNREVAEKFGVIVTKVKVFPTDSGWMILDLHINRPLHRGLKNELEANELCQKHKYIRQ